MVRTIALGKTRISAIAFDATEMRRMKQGLDIRNRKFTVPHDFGDYIEVSLGILGSKGF